MRDAAIIEVDGYVLAPSLLVWRMPAGPDKAGPELIGYVLRDLHGRDGWNWRSMDCHWGGMIEEEPFESADAAFRDMVEWWRGR